MLRPTAKKNGVVEFFNNTKGLGKILEVDGNGKMTGNEYFVHQSEVKMGGLRVLFKGEQVTYSTAHVGEHSDPQAIEVNPPAERPDLTVRGKVPVLNLRNKSIDLAIDRNGRIFVGSIATSAAPSVEWKRKQFRAYPVSEKPERGFNLAIPVSNEQAAYVLLDHNKRVCETIPGKTYHNVRVGSYFVKLVKVRSNPDRYRIWIYNLGFRQQKHQFGVYNWAVLELRFHGEYDSSAPVELQTPVTGMPIRDNDGFVPAIQEALARTNANKLQLALQDMLEEVAEDAEPVAIET